MVIVSEARRVEYQYPLTINRSLCHLVSRTRHQLRNPTNPFSIILLHLLSVILLLLGVVEGSL